MTAYLRPALVLMALFIALTGLAYPFAITGIAQAILPAQANGSLIARNGQVVGSELIGQNFAEDRYFKMRPSATSAPDPKDSTKTVDAPYNAASSTGSNLGPTSKKLIERIKTDADQLAKDTNAKQIPADAVTTSASGLDPHISPAYARLQIARVAEARKIPAEKIVALVAGHIETPLFGVIGEQRVNVLKLNLALDRLTP